MPGRKLYWCTTSGLSDDWFVVARSAREASRVFRDEEGYGAGDAQAKLVVGLPEQLAELPSGWPTNEAIVACGDEKLVRSVKQPSRIGGEAQRLEERR
jgi:hypothetical protein